MPPALALILCAAFVAGLLVIERKEKPPPSIALWVPTCWMLICGSRPIGAWFSGIQWEGTFEEGSFYDRTVLSVLILLSLAIIVQRRVDWKQFLAKNKWLLVLYAVFGVSVLWSAYPFVSAKRWLRLMGAVPVAMVVLTEKSPAESLVRIFRRCAYILLPLSIVLIKYYPHLGRGYGRWSGVLMWHGVTLTKNALAQLALLSAFFIVWAYLRDRREARSPGNSWLKASDGLVLAIAVYLMVATPSGAYSATSIATLVAVTGSLFFLFRGQADVVKRATLLIWGVILGWLSMILGSSLVRTASSILGRDETLTGRTEIWAMALADASRHPFLGAGFGGYFNTGNEFSVTYGHTGHNGLLDVYVEVGILGCAFLLLFLRSFFRHSKEVLKQDVPWGIFCFCLLAVSLLTNYTESLFAKSSSYIWTSMVFVNLVIFSLTRGRPKAASKPGDVSQAVVQETA